jgi:spore coat protein CotH
MKTKVLIIILFASHLTIKAQNPGDILFSTLIHNVYLNFSIPSWYDTLANNYNISNGNDSNIYFPCDIVINGISLNNSGVRFKGNSSYSHPNQKKSFKLDFEEYVSGQKFDNLKQLNLNNSYNDPTFLREKIYLDFCSSKTLNAPRCVYANVYVNNVLWGFYTIIEEIDKTYLESTFGNNGGNLFKGDPSGHLKWLGNVQSNYYNNYELKTNETQNDWSDLINLIDNINNTASNEWIDSITTCFNIQDYLKHYAATILFATLDSYTGSGHNFYLYHNTSSNQFEFIQWDVNGSFGRHHPNGQGLTNEALLDPFWVPTPAGSRPLHEKILQQLNLKQIFTEHLCNYIDTYFDTTSMNLKIDSLSNIIRPLVYADPRKQFTNADFENNLSNDFNMNTPGLKKFVRERYFYLLPILYSYGCSLNSLNNANSNYHQQFYCFPNPSNTRLFFSTTLDGIKIFNVVGELMGPEILSANSIATDNLKNGVYFLCTKQGSQKIIIQHE